MPCGAADADGVVCCVYVLTDVAARVATGRTLHVERQRRYGVVLDAVQEEALAKAGRHQPVGGGERQHHQHDDDEAADEGDHLRA